MRRTSSLIDPRPGSHSVPPGAKYDEAITATAPADDRSSNDGGDVNENLHPRFSFHAPLVPNTRRRCANNNNNSSILPSHLCFLFRFFVPAMCVTASKTTAAAARRGPARHGRADGLTFDQAMTGHSFELNLTAALAGADETWTNVTMVREGMGVGGTRPSPTEFTCFGEREIERERERERESMCWRDCACARGGGSKELADWCGGVRCTGWWLPELLLYGTAAQCLLFSRLPHAVFFFFCVRHRSIDGSIDRCGCETSGLGWRQAGAAAGRQPRDVT